jgi:hypothetical protein
LYAFKFIVVCITITMSKNTTNEKTSQVASQWADLIGQLFDRLTGKGASVTYTFENLIIDIPKAVGPNGQEIGSANWTINGRLEITAEASTSTASRD